MKIQIDYNPNIIVKWKLKKTIKKKSKQLKNKWNNIELKKYEWDENNENKQTNWMKK